MLRVAVCAIALSLAFVAPAGATGSHKKDNKKDNTNIEVDVDSYNKNYNTNHNSNANHNHNHNTNHNNNRNNNDIDVNNHVNNNNNNNIDLNNRNRNDVDVNNRVKNNNNVDIDNRNKQRQGQDQQQSQAQNQGQNQQANASSSSDNQNNVNMNMEGDETFISYEEAASAAATVFASQCQIGGSAQDRNRGGAFVNETQQCRYLRQAQAYFQLMLANVSIVGPHLDGYRNQMREDILQWEEEFRTNQDEEFRQDLIKGANNKSEAQIIAEQRFIANKKRMLTKLLQKRYEQYEDVEWLRVEQYDKYTVALEGFYNSIDSANVSIKRRGLTGFFAEFATDVAWPLGLAAVLFKGL